MMDLLIFQIYHHLHPRNSVLAVSLRSADIQRAYRLYAIHPDGIRGIRFGGVGFS